MALPAPTCGSTTAMAANDILRLRCECPVGHRGDHSARGLTWTDEEAVLYAKRPR